MNLECCCGIVILFLFTIPPIILQGFGCFQESLLHTQECGDIGLLTGCCFDHCNKTKTDYIGPRKISDTAAGLQITAFITVIASVLITICYISYRFSDHQTDDNDKKDCLALIGLIVAFVLFTISGIFCVVACSLVARLDNRQNDSSLGAAFYCSLVSGIYDLVPVAILICNFWCDRCRNMCKGCSICDCGGCCADYSRGGYKIIEGSNI